LRQDEVGLFEDVSHLLIDVDTEHLGAPALCRLSLDVAILMLI